MSHTNGPWSVYQSPDDKGGNLLVLAHAKGPNLPVICDLLRGEVPTAEREANANLIAAAPELLAVCLELDVWERDPDHYGGDLAELAIQARTAIAKAEGK